MSIIHTALLGTITAGVVWGAWPVVFTVGILSLVVRRSYIVLCVGVVLDTVLVTTGDVFVFPYVYSTVFILTTVIAERVRKHIFWKR